MSASDPKRTLTGETLDLSPTRPRDQKITQSTIEFRGLVPLKIPRPPRKPADQIAVSHQAFLARTARSRRTPLGPSFANEVKKEFVMTKGGFYTATFVALVGIIGAA